MFAVEHEDIAPPAVCQVTLQNREGSFSLISLPLSNRIFIYNIRISLIYKIIIALCRIHWTHDLHGALYCAEPILRYPFLYLSCPCFPLSGIPWGNIYCVDLINLKWFKENNFRITNINNNTKYTIYINIHIFLSLKLTTRLCMPHRFSLPWNHSTLWTFCGNPPPKTHNWTM